VKVHFINTAHRAVNQQRQIRFRDIKYRRFALARTEARAIARVVEIDLPVGVVFGNVTLARIFTYAQVIAIHFPVGEMLLQDLLDQVGARGTDHSFTGTVRCWQFDVDCLFDLDKGDANRIHKAIELGVDGPHLLGTVFMWKYYITCFEFQ